MEHEPKESELQDLVLKYDERIINYIKNITDYKFIRSEVHLEFSNIKIYSTISSRDGQFKSVCIIPLDAFYNKFPKFLKEINFLEYYCESYTYITLYYAFDDYLKLKHNSYVYDHECLDQRVLNKFVDNFYRCGMVI